MSTPRKATRIIATEEAFTCPEVADAFGRLDPQALEADLDARMMHRILYEPSFERVKAVMMDLDSVRLQFMDEAGVDQAVLSLVAPGVQSFDAATATELAAVSNDRLAEAIARHPTRFAGLACFAPQDPDAAAQEIERAITKLGLNGILVNSHTYGEYLDDPKFTPILEAAVAVGAPLYIHPRNPPAALIPFLYTAGKAQEGTYPSMVHEGGGFRLTETSWGYHAETGLHVARMLVSDVFVRFPELQVVLGHLGEGLPFLLHRTDWMVRGGNVPRLPSEIFKDQFHVTTSGLFQNDVWENAFRLCLALLGPERILFAADFPFARMTEAVQTFEACELPPEHREQIAWKNAVSLFNIRG